MPDLNVQITTYAESCVPPLKSGEYEIDVTHESSLGLSETKKQKLSVDGPRFSLNPTEINSVFPPDGLSGRFSTVLPHIVFNRKTLPWERNVKTFNMDMTAINGVNPLMEKPWMALLLLCEHEIPEIKTATVMEAISPNPDVYFPKLYIDNKEQGEMCKFIDIDFTLFKNITPSAVDLIYLCHARKLEAYRKANGENLDEWVSVLVCNRLPQGIKQKAFVVSLEGYEGALEAAAISSPKVRLIVLHEWEFTTKPDAGHFGEIAENLSVKQMTLEQKTKSDQLNKIQQNGYVPVKHEMRNGDKTVSFYRGALCPANVSKREYTVTDADALYKYDPGTGMFDISYSSAWQVGRLIALNNMSVALKIMKNRGQNHRIVHNMQLRGALGDAIGIFDNHQAVGDSLLESLNDILEKLL